MYRHLSLTLSSTWTNAHLNHRDTQMVEDGYEFFAERRLVTLFSAPQYGEFANSGAMMSVDDTLMCAFQVRKNDCN